MTANVLLWFRQDLRLDDQPALVAALAAARSAGGGVVPVFIWSPKEEVPWAPGGASQWWLAQSLRRLQSSLAAHGSQLILRTGDAESTLLELVRETKSTAVFWNRRYEPALIARDTKVKARLEAEGVRVQSFNGSLLREPWELKTKTGGPYQVYTPFWRALVNLGDPPEPQKAPTQWALPSSWPKSEKLESWGLEPRIPWDQGMRAQWTPGEESARKLLQTFARKAVHEYQRGRDVPAQDGTSRLSPYLHFGEISPRRIWHTVSRDFEGDPGSLTYLKEIVWREFAYHLLFHFPHTDRQPLREQFAKFPWRAVRNAETRAWLRAWQRGQTGYPLVDAGMRQLWHWGWMHNRVRMVVASFLVKHLQISWQEGAAWFWDTLVDADLASNTLGWQWTAGCGADAAPYFRVFNPILQGEKFDPEGEYIRTWIPELGKVPAKWIHRPWEAPDEILVRAGVELGRSYPRPIVNHSEARNEALAAYKRMGK
ncbi:MAG: deoxyribodipyrimidine photo-lyase [Bdellovibrionales bacterium]|nr:deoxyribodipyrimidine photo-lyase [Bdellovibrionales bacterium]